MLLSNPIVFRQHSLFCLCFPPSQSKVLHTVKNIIELISSILDKKEKKIFYHKWFLERCVPTPETCHSPFYEYYHLKLADIIFNIRRRGGGDSYLCILTSTCNFYFIFLIRCPTVQMFWGKCLKNI